MAKRNSKLQTRSRKDINPRNKNNPSSRSSNPRAKTAANKKNLSSSHASDDAFALNALTSDAINDHLGQIYDDVDQLLDSYQFLLHAIEALHIHSSFNEADLGGVAFMRSCLRDEGERLLEGIGSSCV